MKNFRCLNLAIELYRESKKAKLPYPIKDQLIRASSSVALNLAEGNQRFSEKDKRKFFNIALTSLREVQCIVRMEELTLLFEKADRFGAMVFQLNKNISIRIE